MATPASNTDQPWRTFLIFALLGPVLGGAIPFAFLLADLSAALSDTPVEPIDRVRSGLSNAGLGILFACIPAIGTGLVALAIKRSGRGGLLYLTLCSLFGAAFAGAFAGSTGGGGMFLWTMTAAGALSALICALLTWRNKADLT